MKHQLRLEVGLVLRRDTAPVEAPALSRRGGRGTARRFRVEPSLVGLRARNLGQGIPRDGFAPDAMVLFQRLHDNALRWEGLKERPFP